MKSMYKLSALYKNIIKQITGVQNEIDFEALALLFEEYFSAKEDEEIKETKNYDDE